VIVDVGQVAGRYRLQIDKFEDVPGCQHWRRPVTGDHCGHYIESAVEEGEL
jgi:hypothetical protein